MFEEILFRIGLVSAVVVMYWSDFNAKNARFFDMLGFVETQKFAKLCAKNFANLIFSHRLKD